MSDTLLLIAKEAFVGGLEVTVLWSKPREANVVHSFNAIVIKAKFFPLCLLFFGNVRLTKRVNSVRAVEVLNSRWISLNIFPPALGPSAWNERHFVVVFGHHQLGTLVLLEMVSVSDFD